MTDPVCIEYLNRKARLKEAEERFDVLWKARTPADHPEIVSLHHIIMTLREEIRLTQAAYQKAK